MAKRSSHRRHHHRARVCLAAMGVAAFLLLIFNIVSMVRERARYGILSASNLRLAGEGLALEVERQLWQKAEECLEDPEIIAVMKSLADSSAPGDTARLETRLRLAAESHPLAQHFFLIRDNQAKVLQPAISSLPDSASRLPTLETVYDKTSTLPEAATQEAANIAQALEDHWRQSVPATAGSVHSIVLRAGSRRFQIYHDTIPADDLPQTFFGFSVNTDWVAETLLRLSRQQAKIPDLFQMSLDTSRAGGQAAGTESVKTASLEIPLRTVLPFASLRVSSQSTDAEKRAALTEMFLTGGSAIMMIALLALIGVFYRRASLELNFLEQRSDFLSGISHELKAPLSLISLYSETLSTDEGLAPSERQHCYQVISRESEKLKLLISNLLHLAAMDRNKDQYRLETGDLMPLIEKTLATCSQWYEKKLLAISFEPEPHPPPVRFDAEKVTRAFLNLMDNARKYSKPLQTVTVRLKASGPWVVLEVEDQGAGIPASEHSRIFEQFYRGSNVAQQQGSGIGLFLVRRVMKAHGGNVEVDSRIGHGSRFRMIFPAVAPKEEPAVVGERYSMAPGASR